MLPLATAPAVTLPPPIINTALPGTTAVLHLPYTQVTPPVSNAQVDNNARGNSSYAPVARPGEEDAPAAEDGSVFTLSTRLTPASPAFTAQATFLTQLLAQDSSPETQGILAQYEKRTVPGATKHKPVNVSGPDPEPPGLFGKLTRHDASFVAPAAAIRAYAATATRIAPPPPVDIGREAEDASA